MDEASRCRTCAHWPWAVWGIRVMFAGLTIVVIGLVALLLSADAAREILAVGVGIYLIGVVICVAGIALVYREVPRPRPNFLNLRWALLHDAAHGGTAESVARADASGLRVDRRSKSPNDDDIRRSIHWRPAVWGVRVMGVGGVLVVVSFVMLALSTGAGKTILAVGVGIYVVGLAFTLIQLIRAHKDAPESQRNHARVQRILLHDALHPRL